MTNDERTVIATLMLVAVSCFVGCDSDPQHPTGAAALGTPKGPAVATVDGRRITASEAEEFAATREAPTAADLLERERLVGRALNLDVDVELARKQAMVSALLEDEVEAENDASALEPAVLDEQRKLAAAELKGFSGFHAMTIRVASIDLLTKRAELSEERVAELTALVDATSQRIYDELPAEDALQAAENLDLSWVDSAVRVERKSNVKILTAKEFRDKPPGWIRSRRLAKSLNEVADGAKSQMFSVNAVPVFAIRRSKIDAKPVDPSEVEAIALGRALKETRAQRLDAMLEKLRRKTSIKMQPEMLTETQ